MWRGLVTGLQIQVPKTTEAAVVGRRLAPHGIVAAAIYTTTTVSGTYGARGCPAPSASFPRCGQDQIKEECLGVKQFYTRVKLHNVIFEDG